MTPALIPYILLFAALTAALGRAGPAVVWLLAACSALSALPLGVIAPEGMWGIGLGAALALAPALWPSSRRLLLCVLAGTGLFAVGSLVRILPGFPSLVLIEQFGRTGEGVLAWRYDKGFAGLVLVWLHQRYLACPVSVAFIPRFAALLSGPAVLLALAMSIGLVTGAPALVTGWWLWILGNIYLTVIAQEAFFRGLIQRGLDRLFSAYALIGHIAAVGMTATLFGLVHLPWGARLCNPGRPGRCFVRHSLRARPLPGLGHRRPCSPQRQHAGVVAIAVRVGLLESLARLHDFALAEHANTVCAQQRSRHPCPTRFGAGKASIVDARAAAGRTGVGQNRHLDVVLLA